MLPVSLTVKQFAESEQMGVGTVLDLIAAGELVAYDISRKSGGKPSWRIAVEERQSFRERRSSVKPAKVTKPRRKSITKTTEEAAAAYWAGK